MKRGRPQRFTTHYITEGGILMVLAEEYFLLIRLSDGMCGRFRYDQWDMPKGDLPTKEL